MCRMSVFNANVRHLLNKSCKHGEKIQRGSPEDAFGISLREFFFI